eukprot:6208783-Pleurochrysis_carterae.AAC.1
MSKVKCGPSGDVEGKMDGKPDQISSDMRDCLRQTWSINGFVYSGTYEDGSFLGSWTAAFVRLRLAPQSLLISCATQELHSSSSRSDTGRNCLITKPSVVETRQADIGPSDPAFVHVAVVMRGTGKARTHTVAATAS